MGMAGIGELCGIYGVAAEVFKSPTFLDLNIYRLTRLTGFTITWYSSRSANCVSHSWPQRLGRVLHFL